MKVKCELCGGMLQIHKGGMALCTECGLGYSMERLREMREHSSTVEELIASFTSVPLNPSEELLDDPFDVFCEEPADPPPDTREAPPEVPLSTLLSTLKPPPASPYEVQVKPRDRPRLDLMTKAYQTESFLMMVDDVYAVGTVGADVIGTVDSGTVKPGDTVLINGERPCEVMAIEHHGLRHVCLHSPERSDRRGRFQRRYPHRRGLNRDCKISGGYHPHTCTEAILRTHA